MATEEELCGYGLNGMAFFRFSGKWASVSVSLGLFCLLPFVSCQLPVARWQWPEVPCQPSIVAFKTLERLPI